MPHPAKIAVFTAPKTVGFIERPLDAPKPGEARVETLFSGISHGTEMNVYRGQAPQWTRRYDPERRLFLPVEADEVETPARGYWKPSDPQWDYPLAYGYANVGRVTAVGEGVASVQPGDLVYAFEPHKTAYIAPAQSLIRLPQLANPAVGVLFSNLNTAYNGVLDSDIRLDDTVVVFGQGVIGLLVTQFVRRAGAGRVIAVDPIAARREQALQVGADAALDPGAVDVALRVRDMTAGRGADVVIDVSGSYRALHEAIRTAAPDTSVTAMSWYGGTAEALRLADEFHHNRITIQSSQVAGISPNLRATHSLERRTEQVLAAFDELDLEPLLTDRLPFSEAEQAYERVDQQPPDMIQVYLDYGS